MLGDGERESLNSSILADAWEQIAPVNDPRYLRGKLRRRFGRAESGNSSTDKTRFLLQEKTQTNALSGFTL